MSERKDQLSELIVQMRRLQIRFEEEHGIEDIWTNSKLYEMMIANTLGHQMVPGHSGSLDAMDDFGEYEYKHFKEKSSNHSWTFNDFSDTTIAKLDQVASVVFAHIDDRPKRAIFDWAFIVPGHLVGNYMSQYTRSITNSRRMINISAKQLEDRIGAQRMQFPSTMGEGLYSDYIAEIFDLSESLEHASGVQNVLTSNKFWEVLVSIPLGHQVNGEQGGRAGAHDAHDQLGRNFEYKVSKSTNWQFQDISENVLRKYYQCEEIIMAVVDKENFLVKTIYSAPPSRVVPLLKEKLERKEIAARNKGVEVRRLQVTLSGRDLKSINAVRLV